MATQYTYTTITIPGASRTFATAINDSGEVVGDYSTGTSTAFAGFTDVNGTYTTIIGAGSTQINSVNASGEIAGLDTNSTGNFQGYIDDNGVFTTINSPYLNSYAVSINNSGEVVGEPGYLYANGVFTALNAPGAIETDTDAINNNGEVVGSYYMNPSNTVVHGFTYQNGVFTTFDPPGSTGTYATAINDSGMVVGYDFYVGGEAGFIDNNGTYATINPAGSTSTIPTGVNASGEVAGYYYNSSGTEVGFIYDQGTYTTIAPTGSTNTVLTGINASGEVAGYYYDSSGEEHGFTASPAGPPTVAQIKGVADDVLQFYSDEIRGKSTTADLSKLTTDVDGLDLTQATLGQVLTDALQASAGSNATTLANDLAGIYYPKIETDLSHNGTGLPADLTALAGETGLVGATYGTLASHESAASALKQTVALFKL
jgi:hypothetical protein